MNHFGEFTFYDVGCIRHSLPSPQRTDAGNYGGSKDPSESDEHPRQHFVPHALRPGSSRHPVALLVKVDYGKQVV